MALLVSASDDAVKGGVHAGNLLKLAAPLVDGRGGGAPASAQGGGQERRGSAGGARSDPQRASRVRSLRSLVALALASATLLGARPRPVALPPAVVLARYSAALHALAYPPAQSFDYAVEQLGLRDMEQTHHVYLSAKRERDETTIVDGYTLKRPSVRIIANRTNRYDIAAIAPTTAAYTFAFRGAVTSGTHVLYDFATVPLVATSFAVSEIQIDGTHFLPARIYFKMASGTAHGSGQLGYGLSERYWVVRDAQVNAHLAGGATAHEHIVWSNYSFPSGLPPSTFDEPHPHAVEVPGQAAARGAGTGFRERPLTGRSHAIAATRGRRRSKRRRHENAGRPAIPKRLGSTGSTPKR